MEATNTVWVPSVISAPMQPAVGRSCSPLPRQKSLAASRGALEVNRLVMTGSPLTSCVLPLTAASWPTPLLQWTQAGRGPRLAQQLPSHLTTWAFCLGIQTEHVTRGLIRFVPKGRLSGLPDVEDMRPITLLSEIGKVSSRILASRVSAILDAKPELLHVAQRAFLSNGDVSQCIHTALDVFEDFRSLKRNNGKALHVMSYDVQKAYDSVQLDSIRATLHRYRFPALAIDYICSGLVGARSAVITAHGLTDPFDVRRSAKETHSHLCCTSSSLTSFTAALTLTPVARWRVRVRHVHRGSHPGGQLRLR